MPKKKFKINVIRTEYGFVEIEAKNEDEARDYALSGNASFHWVNEEFDVVEIKQIEKC